MKLLIVIPALNEEESIASVIERSLDAKAKIIARSPVTEVEIGVVSDGSTDRTVEIASRYAGRIQLTVFEKNRGYGAAIKQGWKDSDADLLGFMDADGTCDPIFFADLCRAVMTEDADLALGCRLTEETGMPLIRKIGNILFATLLTALAHKRVRDTASGMRVLRRGAYRALLPLPNGLHFTPAMTARALLGPGGGMKLVEFDMPYFERQGQSKLKVIRDGFRFLETILEALFLYHPERAFAFAGAACLAIAMALMARPIAHYLSDRNVEEWMLYQFILGHLAATSAFLMFSVAILSRRVVAIAFGVTASQGRLEQKVENAVRSPFYWLLPAGLVACGIALVGPNLFKHAASGVTYEHWSRFISMSFFFLVAIILIAARVLGYCLDLVSEQLKYLKSDVGLHKSKGKIGAYAHSSRR
jgi:glycosyltransferase involved in cell wall biosynthesis